VNVVLPALIGMPIHPSALDAALEHSVPNAWPCQLHDHVGGPTRQIHPISPSSMLAARDDGRAGCQPRCTHGAVDVGIGSLNRHCHPGEHKCENTVFPQYCSTDAPVSRWRLWLRSGVPRHRGRPNVLASGASPSGSGLHLLLVASPRELKSRYCSAACGGGPGTSTRVSPTEDGLVAAGCATG